MSKMTESQLSICTWADATFGPPASDASIAAHALVEMAELVTACVNDEPAARIGEEIADVVIALTRLGRSLGFDVVHRTSQPLHGTMYRFAEYMAVDAAHAAQHLTRMLIDLLSNGPVMFGAVVEIMRTVARDAAIDLPSAIDAKMAINRARRWTLDGHGHGSHMKDVTP